MTDLDFHFIGTGNAFAPGGLCWNGFLVNGSYLFETPPQALQSLNKLDIDPNELDAVVISHHHGDHFLGLPLLLLHWKHMGRTKPVTIVGPPETEAITRAISASVFPGDIGGAYDLEWRTALPGQPVTLGSLTVEAVPVVHDPRLIQSLGYHCAIGARRFAYTGDTTLCQAVYDLARNPEVLISECASRADNIPVHMNLVEDIPRVRRAAGQRRSSSPTSIRTSPTTGCQTR
ncbi:MAG: MBL fold metallo-hydrolase [Dehalococcoidia bacterium]|nr:MBL fold metallo-hydrolase [Dehalococcoidia bacterium]